MTQNCLNCKWEPEWSPYGSASGLCRVPLIKNLPATIRILFVVKEADKVKIDGQEVKSCRAWKPKEGRKC